MRAVRVNSHGGAEVLVVEDIEPPRPTPSQVLVRVEASGINYLDIYQRAGASPVPPPFTLGVEGAGRVIATGADVADLAVGDLVAWHYSPGSYAEQVAVEASALVRVPSGVPADTASAIMLQGLTAHYLSTSTYPIQPGDTAVVHAAAGGVGLLLTQMVKLRGGRVIATVSSPEKEQLARSAGADEVIRYDGEDVATAVLGLTDGEGAAVVYDGVGQATFDDSLASLRVRGYLVLYGAASGPVPPVPPEQLNSGSLFLTRPNLGNYTRDRAELTNRTDEIFSWLTAGKLQVHIGGRYPLKAAAQAHRDLESRRTAGKLLLQPRP